MEDVKQFAAGDTLDHALWIIRLYRDQHKAGSCSGDINDSYGACNVCREAEKLLQTISAVKKVDHEG